MERGISNVQINSTVSIGTQYVIRQDKTTQQSTTQHKTTQHYCMKSGIVDLQIKYEMKD